MGSLFDDILRAVGITSTPTSRAVRKTGQTGNRPKPSPRREGASRAKKQAASKRLIAAGRALGRPSKTKTGKTKTARRKTRPGLLSSKGRRAAVSRMSRRVAVPKRTMANPPSAGPPAGHTRKRQQKKRQEAVRSGNTKRVKRLSKKLRSGRS